MKRCEQRSRLTKSWNRLSAAQQAFCLEAEKKFDAMIAGRLQPDVLVPPASLVHNAATWR